MMTMAMHEIHSFSPYKQTSLKLSSEKPGN